MHAAINNLVVSLPMPIFLVVEDVGWWQGTDGSANNEPYRNGFSRRHCLDDYRALARLAKRLKMRIALGMVIGEWDRGNLLKDVAGATWMGKSWNNRINQGPWLDEAAQYLREHQDWLEIACHGLCHEFWQAGRMERSEFHDRSGRMRPSDDIRRHLDAFAHLLAEHTLPGFPRLFLPPALHHSFGNGPDSIQAILHDYGIRYVVTVFSRACRYSKPLHEKITWECGVGLLERGLAPVPWHQAAAPPVWDFQNPILPLHWGNLLHHDPGKNIEIVDAWAEMLENKAKTMEYLLAEDFASCWNQAAAYHLVKMAADGQKIALDLGMLKKVPGFEGLIILKIQCSPNLKWQCRGGQVVHRLFDSEGIQTITIKPLPRQPSIEFSTDLSFGQ